MIMLCACQADGTPRRTALGGIQSEEKRDGKIPMTEKPLELMGLRDLHKIMRQKAPPEAWEHFNGAAESKATFRRNPQAFRRYLFRQKIFHEVSEPDISVELFGKTVPIPAITAPVGSFSLIAHNAEREGAE